jgi:MFS family permease
VGYLALLRLPGAARLAFAAIVGRVPIGMVPLAYILLLRAEGESYALAGSVAAALAIASGLAAIPQGRLVDRLGQARVLLVLAALNAAAIVALLLAARAEAAAGALIALGALSGLTIPPLSACMRTLWPVLTGGGERLQTAFALEAVLQEVFYVAGPLLVGAIVAIASPDAAVVTAAVLTLAGTALFVSSPLSRAQRGGSSAAGRLGALAAPGLRTMILVLLPVGIAFGALEVTVPAFAEQHGSRS